MVASMVFYGLSLNTGILYGDYYINFLLVTLVEFPGNVIPLPMIQRIGRIKSHFIYMGVGGLACLSTILTVNYVGKGSKHFTKLKLLFTICCAPFITICLWEIKIIVSSSVHDVLHIVSRETPLVVNHKTQDAKRVPQLDFF